MPVCLLGKTDSDCLRAGGLFGRKWCEKKRAANHTARRSACVCGCECYFTAIFAIVLCPSLSNATITYIPGMRLAVSIDSTAEATLIPLML